MGNMSKSMRMSRQEYSLFKVRNTNNMEIYPHSPRGRMFPPLKTPCIANLSLTPDSDNQPLSAHVPVNTSFRQASPDNPCCAHQHVVLDPSSFNTEYSELWLSGFSVSSRCTWNHSRCSQPVVNLSRCCGPVFFAAQQGPLSQVFRAQIGMVFAPWRSRDGQLSACLSLLHPQGPGYGGVSVFEFRAA